ncbi:Cupredoxin [Podospora aff. communis PSN243]|uniref:Cupredoxin n=1 Tax=Podospora aff. communis PSN243 TaxID=3040156 RepID=A0AAV9GM11_9PEZI|nr:Cupredoxin [Podospora aff. communis PSN243]
MLKSLALWATAASTVFAFPGPVGNTIKLNWDIEWIAAKNPLAPSPRGAPRPVIGINGAWPIPTVEATVGDIVEITINNKLGNETTGIHWHGLHQIGTSHMDGAAGVTQCPVPPGHSFTYKFWLDQSGTYWYHSHVGAQYPDGLRGAFIVKDKVDPYAGQYDEEYLLTVSDWYNQQVPALLVNTIFNASVQMRPPIPDGGLINDGQGAKYKIEAGKKYKFRLINLSAFTGVFLKFDNHDFTIIEIDGVNVKKTEAKLLYLTAAQRYSVIIEAKEDATKNFGISAVFDLNPNFREPLVPNMVNATGALTYDAALPAAPAPIFYNYDDLIDDTIIKPIKHIDLGEPDIQYTLNFDMGLVIDGVPRATVNGKPFVGQKVPTLYTALTTGKDAENPEVYGQINPFVVKKGQVVELILNNKHFAHHPFHFHGHHFQVCQRAAQRAGDAGEIDCSGELMERDTIDIEGASHAVIRFKADNPGIWLFHCHIEWHVPVGLSATIIEDPLALQSGPDKITIPEDHLAACKANCMPTKGNAGGNTVNHLDTSNYNTPQPFDDGAMFVFQECPAGNGTFPPASTTSTIYSTRTYTVSSCAPTVSKCPYGSNGTHVTTEVVPVTTTVCPVSNIPKPRPTFHVGPPHVVPWPDMYEHVTYSHTTTYTVTTSGKPVIKTDVVKGTSAVPINNGPHTTVFGTGSGPKPTGSGKPVTAGAAKAATGFGAAAVAGLLAVAALL